MTFFRKAEPGQPPEYAGIIQRLNQVETKIGQLELMNSERQIVVLNVVEKVLHQLKAREGKRVRDATDRPEDSTEVAADEDRSDPRMDPRPHPVPRRPSTAHLSRRFRLGG